MGKEVDAVDVDTSSVVEEFALVVEAVEDPVIVEPVETKVVDTVSEVAVEVSVVVGAVVVAEDPVLVETDLHINLCVRELKKQKLWKKVYTR
jgi:hypothetical protein